MQRKASERINDSAEEEEEEEEERSSTCPLALEDISHRDRLITAVDVVNLQDAKCRCGRIESSKLVVSSEVEGQSSSGSLAGGMIEFVSGARSISHPKTPSTRLNLRIRI